MAGSRSDDSGCGGASWSTRRVTIVQTYVPAYRAPFFEQLRRYLGEDAIELRLVTSRPSIGQANRGDAVELDWVDQVQGYDVKLGRRNLLLTSTARYWSNSDAVIAMLQGTSLDTNHALASMRRRKIRVGLWGHIKPYTSPGNAADLWIERQQMRRADHVFAYTESGADYAKAVGVKQHCVTSVQNTIDTSELVAARDSLTAADVQQFRVAHALEPGKTFAFIGGLDQPKRIGLVADVLDRLWIKDRSIRLVIGGSGAQSALLDRSIARGQTTVLGRVASRDKALIVANSVAIIMPGRIGLVALDALVLGKPILTTDWPFHAPEAEYLTVGESKFVSRDSSGEFAELILSAIQSRGFQHHVHTKPWRYPTMDAMVANFARGVQSMLQDRPSGGTPVSGR